MTVEESKLEHMLRDIKRDNVSGSVKMARKTATLVKEAGRMAEEGGLELVPTVSRWATSAAEAHEFMALVRSVGRRAAKASSLDDLEHRMDRLLWELENANDRIAERFARLFPDGGAFMTNSFSATVYASLRHLATKTGELRTIVVESRPAREGVQLARALGEHGIPSTLIVDAGVMSFIDRADAVLVGSDIVSRGFFVNKLGTYPMVLAGHSRDKPVYLLASVLKLVTEDEVPRVESPKTPEEVESGEMANVTVENLYFERVPLANLSGVITEEGILSPEDIARRVDSL